MIRGEGEEGGSSGTEICYWRTDILFSLAFDIRGYCLG